MDDTEMVGVTVQDCVRISWQYYFNGRPPHEATNDDDLGSAKAAFTGLASLNCRLALQLENRDFGWLVFKNGHASLEMNRLSLDAAFLGGDQVTENGVSAANKAISFNDDKFRNEAGDCLFGDCTTSWIDNSPAVRAQYPES
ncbi:hypothetical protein, partial [Alcanivorax sp. HI0003]|uniref:hypothetical protein n=1 Tax=Alcanivorax sp. HI0003 TaxID=1822217 RepID=UPI0018D2AA19